MEEKQTLPRFDKKAVRRSFGQAAANYDEAAVLQREVGDRLLERLEYIKCVPRAILEVGSGTGYCTSRLAEYYPEANIFSLDLSLCMLQHQRQKLKSGSNWLERFRSRFRQQPYAVCADAESLPFQNASIDLIFSNLTIQWCSDLHALFKEFRRVMRPGGLLLFTTFGPDTLKELKHSWSEVSDGVHVNNFTDMHEIGDLLQKIQTENPVMDAEFITMTYGEVRQLMLDIKSIGAHNQNQGRPAGLMGKSKFQRMLNAYERFRRTDGTYPATWEILYGHAWIPHTPLQERDDSGRTTITLGQLKSQLQRRN